MFAEVAPPCRDAAGPRDAWPVGLPKSDEQAAAAEASPETAGRERSRIRVPLVAALLCLEWVLPEPEPSERALRERTAPERVAPPVEAVQRAPLAVRATVDAARKESVPAAVRTEVAAEPDAPVSE